MSTLLNYAYKFALATNKRVLNQKRFLSNIFNHTPATRTPNPSVGQQRGAETSSVVVSKQSPKLQFAMDIPEDVFRGVTDRFNGITVDTNEEMDENVNFADKLQKSIDYWIENKRRGIWFKVHTKHSNQIPELTKRGFDFHHAKSGYVMLFRWLPTTEPANVPVFPHTLIGVGGLVVNDNNEVLAVSDKYALIPGSWKLPGGYVEPKEDLIDAAIREVKEETGVSTSFETMIAIRQSHGGSFDCSDLYFVIALKPITTELKACPREIAKVQWMPVTEFLGNPNVHETNRLFVKTLLHYKETGIKFNCISAVHQLLNRKYCLYSIEKQ